MLEEKDRHRAAGAGKRACGAAGRVAGGGWPSQGTWLAGGLPQDRVLAGAQLNQAAVIAGARLLGGSEELLDASVDQVSGIRLLFHCKSDSCPLGSTLPSHVWVCPEQRSFAMGPVAITNCSKLLLWHSSRWLTRIDSFSAGQALEFGLPLQFVRPLEPCGCHCAGHDSQWQPQRHAADAPRLVQTPAGRGQRRQGGRAAGPCCRQHVRSRTTCGRCYCH